MESGNEARKSDGNGFGSGTEMKIMIFPVNIDKFTGFFNKFPKSVFLVTGCNQKGYILNLSLDH